MPSSKIFVTTRFATEHCWPEAPNKVAYLRNMHRHEFHVRAEITVKHDDRDLEFILVKQELMFFISQQLGIWSGRTSCEQMARDILTELQRKYGVDRTYTVEVSEDGENGAIITI